MFVKMSVNHNAAFIKFSKRAEAVAAFNNGFIVRNRAFSEHNINGIVVKCVLMIGEEVRLTHITQV